MLYQTDSSPQDWKKKSLDELLDRERKKQYNDFLKVGDEKVVKFLNGLTREEARSNDLTYQKAQKEGLIARNYCVKAASSAGTPIVNDVS